MTAARLLRRLSPAGEDGIALVLAVLILAVLSISAVSAIYYTSASQKDAFSNKARQSAYTLAQGGVSNAIGQLTSHYYDASGQPKDNVTSLTSQAGWAASGSQQSPGSTAACTTTSTCMTWSVRLDCPAGVSCAGGSTISVSGIARAMWHVTAVGTLPNPNAQGRLTRTITLEIPVETPPAKVGAPDIFKLVYSGKPPSGGCDMDLAQGVVFKAPVYVVGNLCVSNPQAGVQSPATLVVGGWLKITNGSVGSSSSPLSSIAVGGACNGLQATTPQCSLVFNPVNNYYTNVGGSIFSATQVSTVPAFPTPPSVDWPARQQESVGWSCTGGKALDSANFDLGGSAYDCRTPSGRLTWDGSHLTVSGNVYVSGNLTTPNSQPDFIYSGIGGIYVGGTVDFPNNTTICVGSVSNHDCPSGASWDTDNNFLLILAKGAVASAKNFSLEGGLYSDANITIGSGQTHIYGPLVTPQQIDPGQQAASGFPNVTTIVSGAPGTPAPYWTLGTPTNGTY